MSDNKQQNLDNIQESKSARWAYRIAWIPLIGVPLFIIIALFSIFRIGSKGQFGLYHITKGTYVFVINSIVLIVLIVVLSSEWFNNRYYYNFPYIQQKYTGQLNNQKQKHGKWIEWYSNGNKRNEGIYNNGLKQGKWLGWYPSGNKQYEESYSNGQKHGISMRWWTDGQKIVHDEYINGKLVGYDDENDKSATVEKTSNNN